MKHTEKITLKSIQNKKPALLDRIIKSGADYMANFAVVRGNLSPFQSGSIQY